MTEDPTEKRESVDTVSAVVAWCACEGGESVLRSVRGCRGFGLESHGRVTRAVAPAASGFFRGHLL